MNEIVHLTSHNLYMYNFDRFSVVSHFAPSAPATFSQRVKAVKHLTLTIYSYVCASVSLHPTETEKMRNSMEEERFGLSHIPDLSLFAFQWTSYVKGLFFVPRPPVTAMPALGFVIFLFI